MGLTLTVPSWDDWLGQTPAVTSHPSDPFVARSVAAQTLRVTPGHSGYFSHPTLGLDPALVGADGNVRDDVGRQLLSVCYSFLEREGFRHPQRWITLWIAGSALSHQWAADRAASGPGDLDCLAGIDYPEFWQANPQYRGFSEAQMVMVFNGGFTARLDPQTAAMSVGGRIFEVTFYVNPNSSDIRNINPYAAYNLTDREWTVHPLDVQLDWNPHTYFPVEWWERWEWERQQALELVGQFSGVQAQLRTLTVGTPEYVNAARRLHDVARQSSIMFRDIHDSRRQAFSPTGKGYYDYFNARWQAHKSFGTTAALHAIKSIDDAAHIDTETQCYGAPIVDTAHALLLAALAGNRSAGNRHA